jgi:hypothetical protein
MEAFIPMKHIPTALDGEEDWTYSYVEPSTATGTDPNNENAKLADTETRDRLLAAREGLYKEYEQTTMEWIRNADEGKTAEIKARREAVAERLRVDYWVVDPYVRARSYYDRIGVLLEGGKLNWYPEAEGKAVPEVKVEGNGAAAAAAAAPVAKPVVETSADDVD